jgi:hypothetical protein
VKKWLLILMLLIPLVTAQAALPPREFFVKEYTPQTIIVVGDTASAEDVISATLLATRIADMATRKKVEITEVVHSETKHTAVNKVPFVWSNYYLLFDLDLDLFWFNYHLEKLRDTIPGGFIPTIGRTWASRTTQINLLGDYYCMLEIRKYNDYSWWYLFYGIPRNFEHQYLKNGESRQYGKYKVTLLEVDVDEMEAKIRVESDALDDTVILPVYCKDCKHVVGELFCNALDPLTALDAADQLQADYPSYFINLKYFVGGPLSNSDAVARANWYWNPPPVPGTPDMFIDGQFHIDSTSLTYFEDYFNAFYASVQIEIPLRVYTTGFIREDKGQVNAFLSSDYNVKDLALYTVIFEKHVDMGGTIYRNVVQDVSPPVFLTLRAGQTFEYSYEFAVPSSVTDPCNLGAVVFVQNTVTKRIHQADVLDLGEKRFVYEVDIDADFDGRAEEVEFAIECTKIPFLGIQGNAWARFNIYMLTDYGVLFPRCCDTPFFEDEVMKWDLEIFKEHGLGYILVKVCDPFDIKCLKPGDIIYGPRHLARIKILEVLDTEVQFLFQFMKTFETEVEGERAVEPSSLLRLASEATEEELEMYNLIVIGGPDVNPFTKEIVDMGLSQVDWSLSRGEWELISNPFGYGRDVLIVAGKDRDRTSFAARKLYHALELYEE